MFICKPYLSAARIVLDGRDAEDFLHRLTTAHIKALSVGQGSLGCFLSPQGKVLSLFVVWKENPQRFALEVFAKDEPSGKQNLLGLIERYTFAEKFEVHDQTADHSSFWLFPDGSELESELRLAPLQFKNDPELGILGHQGPFLYGTQSNPWLTVWTRKENLDQVFRRLSGKSSTLSWEQLEWRRILANHPAPGSEITDHSNPLEIGLRSAIAENKGCYPGQEVIEKIISLGSPPRRLARIEGSGPAPVAGSKLIQAEPPHSEVGVVTSAAARPAEGTNEFACLALIKKVFAKENLSVSLGDPSTSSLGRIIQLSS